MSRLEGVFKGQFFFPFFFKIFLAHFPIFFKFSRIEIYYFLKN